MKKALLIGINYYHTNDELVGCHTDINDVAAAYANSFDKVTILIDVSADRAHDSPSCPTTANILNAMREFTDGAMAGDYLYFHFSGHGTQIIDLEGDEVDGFDECICPVDYVKNGVISDDMMYEILCAHLPAGVKLRAIFDCCHSGSILDLPLRWLDHALFTRENNNTPLADIITISGCRDDQLASDASFGGHPNGALTWALLKALAEIRKSKSKFYRWKDLAEMIKLRLKKGGYDQIPQLCVQDERQISAAVDLLF